MTNGGGKPEAQRCEELSRQLETKVCAKDKEIILNIHTAEPTD
jgi:hypothetical protein